jgi:hypothetical protein
VPRFVHPTQSPWELRKKKLKRFVPRPIWSALKKTKETIMGRRPGANPWEWEEPWKKRRV